MTFPPPRSGRSPTEPPPISNIPEQGLPFNGRDEQIARLTKLFRQYGHVLLHDAESGHGFGKTQMAIAYCWRFTLRYDVVWWFKCSDETDDDRLLTLIETQEQELLELCAQTLGGPPKPRPDSRWLFVYDNVSDPDRIYEHFVPGAGHRLVISRTKGLTWGENCLALGGLSPTIAEALLLQQAESLTGEQAERLARRAKGHPGTLLTAAEIVRQSGYEGYMDRFGPSTPPHGTPIPGSGSLLGSTDKRTLIEAIVRSPVNGTRETFDLWVQSIRLALKPVLFAPLIDGGSARNRVIAIVNEAATSVPILTALANAMEEQDDHEATRVVRRLVDKATAGRTATADAGRPHDFGEDP
ncbi:hypothetical protein [Streptomyces acidiscabies]|uniref:NB-ARC domain-containing protein n=1 Tax=Streptomyces acidiscabies TaxID=42234 RepID=A0AAP6EDJ2_9ACTN|nr:hypothetical protein [Streptomyces acidiscabies]MBZ3911623.1 hypothetical protein [Streptomyces acidiscabies]MDX2958848.1 hypothetical protein [Streptomyces acidiscabies]MDX3018285.1 hypothetical protein [Streptomyces acidiscabies]MDX3791683.1 hypothetical protein [Streptomyces acidiscabies]GAV43031.1 hypothetical protein Saa2_05978 [Streptomyces acidiscabies]